MDSEHLEHELSLLEGKDVSIVRPFGEQSDSYPGSLAVHKGEYPVAFEFQSPLIAIRFKVSDVIKVNRTVIYLKGPTDYREHYHDSHC